MSLFTSRDVVRDWIATGVELGQLEADFADMERPNLRGPVTRARTAWMRAIQAVRALARLSDTAQLDRHSGLGARGSGRWWRMRLR